MAVLLILGGIGCKAGEQAGGAPATGGGPSSDGATGGSRGDGAASDGRPGQPATDAGTASGGDDAAASPMSVMVRLVPQAGVSGTTRVNFAVPLARGQLADAAAVRVLAAGAEIPSARRALARYPDGSVRSVQVQIDRGISSSAGSAETSVTVEIGRAPTVADVAMMPVASTLDPADGTAGPRVWALLPASWLSASGVAGPQVPEADVAGTPLAAWQRVCDYATYDVTNFLSQMSNAAVWLFDRGTAAYRGYARRGDMTTLETAYRETAIYRAGITGTGADTRIAVSPDDLKYHYTQNMAIHYLLTGDDRFREAAEAVGRRAAALWPSPGYAGGSDFWTERHAGFALLAYDWAMIVSDDASAEFAALADTAVDAYLSLQDTYPVGYADANARCFAHSADAHGENFGYFGCSPWMSAILADGLDAYATERGGDRAAKVRAALVKLARSVARDGHDPSGKPYYWMGVGTPQDEVDPDDEHWGESAYVVALGWYHGGRSDTALESAARALVDGFAANDTAPHMRSFNWQCRSAVATPYYLK
jgi:hypothetical protein